MAWTDDIRQLAERARSVGVNPDPYDALTFHLEAADGPAAEALVPTLDAQFQGVAKAELISPDERTGEMAAFVRLTFPDVDSELAGPVAYDAAYELAAQHGLVSAEPDLPSNFFVEPGQVPPSADAESAIVSLFCEVPRTPKLPKTWALDLIRANEAIQWSVAQGKPAGGAGVLVAQPDTGITPNPDFETGSVAVGNGWDLIKGQAGAIDPNDYGGNKGHGTGTGSCVVSRPEGDMQGSAPAAVLYPIRCIKTVVVVRADPIVKAIQLAVRQNANVITMSLGGVPDRALRAAVRDAVAKGVIVLAAAGNCVGVVVWPARYADCIAVGGCNIDRAPWKGSCRGLTVDITAPAEKVWHADPETNPAAEDGQGTSYAVALTAGAAAQWLGHFGIAAVKAEAAARGTSVQHLFRTALQATAQTSVLLPTNKFGAGIVNVEALLKKALADIPPVVVPVDVAADDPATGPPREFLDLLTAFGGSEATAQLDWRLYGRELGHVALQRAVTAKSQDDTDLTETTPPPTSRGLKAAAAASGDEGLQKWVGKPEPVLP